MNPHAPHSISPVALIETLWGNKNLIAGLVKRDVIGRYRGSIMGLLWSFFNPVLMLVVYTIVFSVVFKSRWVGGSDSKSEFALVLFVGLLIFNLFSECIARSPSLILGNVNYVKKVVFPIEIFPVVVLGSAIFHFLVGIFVWMIFYMMLFGWPSPYIFLMPLVMVPLFLIILGVSWFLASLGVYIRDATHIVGVTLTVLMFLSPIFYPVTALPEPYRPYLYLNPLTFLIEQARNVMVWRKGLDWYGWLLCMFVSLTISWVAFAWFQKTRKGFADVL